MEIKTGKQIYDFFDSSLCPDSFSKPPIEFFKEQKWIKLDDVKEWLLDEIHRSGAPSQMFREFEKSLSTTDSKES
jgi:hypothetical protein